MQQSLHGDQVGQTDGEQEAAPQWVRFRGQNFDAWAALLAEAALAALLWRRRARSEQDGN